jgi:hypothetical protein
MDEKHKHNTTLFYDDISILPSSEKGRKEETKYPDGSNRLYVLARFHHENALFLIHIPKSPLLCII